LDVLHQTKTSLAKKPLKKGEENHIALQGCNNLHFSVNTGGAFYQVRIPDALLRAEFIHLQTAPARTLNFGIPADLANQLEALARFVNVELWQIQQIQTAINEADHEEDATNEDVTAFFAKYGC
jgi:hypothetical protein